MFVCAPACLWLWMWMWRPPPHTHTRTHTTHTHAHTGVGEPLFPAVVEGVERAVTSLLSAAQEVIAKFKTVHRKNILLKKAVRPPGVCAVPFKWADPCVCERE